MKDSSRRLLRKLRKDLLPEPEPDMSDMTSTEQVAWAARRYGLAEALRQRDDPDRPRRVPEEDEALEARDTAVLARRAAAAAAERLARWPDSVAAQQAVRETSEAADKATKAFEEAARLAEEAKRRPRPPQQPIKEETPGAAASPDPSPPKPDAAEPAKVKAAPKPRRPRAPKPKPEPKQWWEERAQWSKRPPLSDDERRGRPLYETIHKYDPLTYHDRDWDED
jgi:hypothetical protein